ncbi:hypothetical protein P3X46_009006 [Hevea brasiliensis]|uniref:WEB family protein n=1 Tax=Hevea brasiliensis TaxID=3981 RepID=A0ABQ9MKG3_HEVBR|nr:WEB family protein At1g12150-like [Hevea brasiliensis]KAJ9180799.1 hypothetical protein P3X46_009006 [Hevea brasiliensis]
MVNIRARDPQKSSGSPKGEVGEIDTRAPFQSVKAAVSLFGEVVVSKDKDKPSLIIKKLSSENVLDKEPQLLLVQRELDKYKQQLEVAEATKSRAHSELEKAMITLNELTTKLKTTTESRLSAVEAAEIVKNQAKELEVAETQQHLGNADRKQELDQVREQYTIIVSKLDLAKQELTQIRQDFDRALEAKSASFQQAAEAQRVANVNIERITELSNEIRIMQESAQQLKLASIESQEQLEKILSEKEACIRASIATKEDVDKRLKSLIQEYDPKLTRKLELKLAETNMEIEVIQEEMKRAHAIEMDTMKLVTTELNEATKTLQQVAEEENLLRNIVTSLRLELEEVRKEKAELEKKEKEIYDQQSSLLEQLTSETESARTEAEEIKKNTNKLNQEAESSMLIVEKAMERLHHALKEVEQAKEAEKKAHDEMKILSEKYKNQNSESNNNIIKISLQEFESLKKKVEECETTADAKETVAIIEVEEIITRKNAAEKKLQENLKAIEEIKEATDIALKSAQLAENAQIEVEGELQRCRQKHDK